MVMLISLFSFILSFFLFFFHDWVSLCSSGYPETQSVDQAILKLTKIHLSLPYNYWD